jgi:deazaflavin-dependent oxidoreductase (nitroreductase family)
VQIPRNIARFNKTVNNPIQRQYAWLVPPWAVIVHRGRRTGRTYRTPVTAFRQDGRLVVAILYGERSDWVQNLLAGGGQVIRGGRSYMLRDIRVVPVGRPGARIPRAARAAGRLSGKLLVAELDGPIGGFGRGPRSS